MNNVAENPEGECIVYAVPHFDFRIPHTSEEMFVMPETVWADSLIIRKVSQRVHVGDFSKPRCPNSKKRTEPVLDRHPFINFRGKISLNLQIQSGRRDFRQIPRIRKEIPAFFERDGHKLYASQHMDRHGDQATTSTYGLRRLCILCISTIVRACHPPVFVLPPGSLFCLAPVPPKTSNILSASASRIRNWPFTIRASKLDDTMYRPRVSGWATVPAAARRRSASWKSPTKSALMRH